jgi:hypothetical protein
LIKHPSVKTKPISAQPITEIDEVNHITDAVNEIKKNSGDLMALIQRKIEVIEVQI